MNRTIVCIVLLVAICFSLIGCKNKSDIENAKEAEAVNTDSTGYASIEEELCSIECVVSMTRTERENPNYFTGLESYSLVYDTDNGTVEVFVLAPDDAINNKYGAIIWCPDARISDYRFAEIAADGYVVFAVYFRGYEGSQSTGIRDYGGDKDLLDLEILLDIITECEFIDKSKIIAVSGVMNCIKTSRLLTTEKGREYISAAAFAQPVADLKDYLEKRGEEYKAAFIEFITDAEPSKAEEELTKRSILEIAEDIDPDTELLVASFGEGEESEVDTEYSQQLKHKFDDLGIYYDEQHFAFPGTDFYVPESITFLKDWINSKFDQS